MSEFFERTVVTRWRDGDALGHVNHAVFLTYLEQARDALYSDVLNLGPEYVVVRIEIDFKAEVRLDVKAVHVSVAVEKIGNSSLTTREEIRLPSGELVTTARVVSVKWSGETRGSLPFTDDERSQLTRYIG